MPRDDLSIDFVKKMGPTVEAQDPQMILEDWTSRTQNLPEELRFVMDEVADKDRTYNEHVKTIEECDLKLQRWIRLHGSHHPNPREKQLRETIRENYDKCERLSNEKLALTQKLNKNFDKHLRYFDAQIQQLCERGEAGFTDPDEIPSLLRPSPANHSNTNVKVLAASTSAPLNPISSNATPTSIRVTNSQIRNAQSQGHISNSAPATPTGSILLNRSQRESSAGPGSSSAPKRGPRSSIGTGNLPTAPSGLARHSSLGPGTPKAGTPAATSRAGSAGPRGGPKGPPSRKSTPVNGVSARKKPPKSTLSRVKRAGTSKGSPASTADSELSDADSATSSRAASRAGSGTPVPSQSGNKNGSGPAGDADGDESMLDRGPEGSGSERDSGDEEDGDDEDEEGKKYCLCQHVSYGDMVACDNDDCPFEWFHWNCVGLKSEPQGRWFCPTCTEEMKKKAGGASGSIPSGGPAARTGNPNSAHIITAGGSNNK